MLDIKKRLEDQIREPEFAVDVIRIARQRENRSSILWPQWLATDVAGFEIVANVVAQDEGVLVGVLNFEGPRAGFGIRGVRRHAKEELQRLKKDHEIGEDEERSLTLELEKTMKIKTKYHDSSRITGTSQRYLTQYLQVQLANQLRAKRIEIALDARNLETLTTTLNDTEKQLRLAKRSLEPLTDGVIKKAKEKRITQRKRHHRS